MNKLLNLYLRILLVTSPVFAINAMPALSIDAINVGWGQAVLIQGPNGTSVLVDAGLKSKRHIVKDFLQKKGISELDYFVLSHNHADHGGGAESVVNHFRPKTSFYSGASNNSERVFMQSWFSAYQGSGLAEPVGMPLGYQVDLGDGAMMTAVAVNGSILNQQAVVSKLRETDPDYQFPQSNHINDSSIVLLVKYKGFDYLISGDLGGHDHNGQHDFETPIITSILLSEQESIATPHEGIDVLHVGHHGSKTSSNSRFVDLAKPEVAIASVGPNQSHGLPNFETIDDVFGSRSIPVLQTDEGKLSDGRTATSGYVIGHINIVTDGLTYTVTGDSSGIDTVKQPNVVSEAEMVGLPLTFPTDNAAVPVVDNAPMASVAIVAQTDSHLSLELTAQDDIELKQAELLLNGIQVESFTLDAINQFSQSTQISLDSLQPGSYQVSFVAIDSKAQVSTESTVSFSIDEIAPAPIVVEEVESNDSINLATQISKQAIQVLGYFPYYYDNYDWYQIELDAGKTLEVNMEGPSDYQQDYDIYLYSEQGTLLNFSENTGTNESFSFFNPNKLMTKKLYILVYRYSGYSWNTPYLLNIKRQ